MIDDPESSSPPAGSGDSLPPGAGQLRMAEILDERRRKEGDYSKLARAIARAVEAGDGHDAHGKPIAKPVDRRKLKQIVEQDPELVLSVGQLRALDLYLEGFGEGLATNPLFVKPELLSRIAATGQATFLLGSKRDADKLRINISHWDVLGLSALQTNLQGYGENLRLDIREVRMHKVAQSAREKGLRDPTLNRLYGEDGPSLICLGSSRGNQMAERMLSAFADPPLPPYTRRDAEHAPDLPFYFVWSRPQDYVLPSQFHLTGEDLLDVDARAAEAVIEGGAACFRYSGGCLVDDLVANHERPGFTYAVCAAQRRKNGKIWLLVAGLTGPATYAAARWVRKMPVQLDRGPTSGRHSPVFWSLLKVHATPVDDGSGASFELADAQVVQSGVGLSG